MEGIYNTSACRFGRFSAIGKSYEEGRTKEKKDGLEKGDAMATVEEGFELPGLTVGETYVACCFSLPELGIWDAG